MWDALKFCYHYCIYERESFQLNCFHSWQFIPQGTFEFFYVVFSLCYVTWWNNFIELVRYFMALTEPRDNFFTEVIIFFVCFTLKKIFLRLVIKKRNQLEYRKNVRLTFWQHINWFEKKERCQVPMLILSVHKSVCTFVFKQIHGFFDHKSISIFF